MQAHEQIREAKLSKRSFETGPEPSVVSVARDYTVNGHGCRSAELSGRVGLILEELGAVVRNGGGFIGHIKAFISTPEGAAQGFSVVRDRVRLQGADFAPEEPAAKFKIAVTAIVYGCPKEELNRLLELALAVGLPRSFCTSTVPRQPIPLKIMASPMTPEAVA